MGGHPQMGPGDRLTTIEGNHSDRFWKLANAYPLMERARGYLMALGLDDEESGVRSQESGETEIS